MDYVYVYIMNSIKNKKDELFHHGSVPWPLWWNKKAYYAKESERLNYQEPGRGEIFFGPCKKEMRWKIRECMEKSLSAKVYVVGLSNSTFKPRAIVYYMKIEGKAMTFGEAYNRFPDVIGIGIHIKPTKKEVTYDDFQYYRKERAIKMPYEPLEVVGSCKKAPHNCNYEWIKDIARDYDDSLKKCGPDCCFISSKDSIFFGKEYIKIDKEFCNLLKKGTPLLIGKLNENEITINNPIPNAKGNHLVLKDKIAEGMVKKLGEIG